MGWQMEINRVYYCEYAADMLYQNETSNYVMCISTPSHYQIHKT